METKTSSSGSDGKVFEAKAKIGKVFLERELEGESDNSLIEMIRVGGRDSNEALKILIQRHYGICVNICRRFISNPQQITMMDSEMLDGIPETIHHAAETYDMLKGKFSTWLGNHARYHCFNVLKKYKKRRDLADRVIENEVYPPHLDDHTHEPFPVAVFNEFKVFLKTLDDKRKREVGEKVLLRSEKWTLREVAKKFGCSTAWVHVLKNELVTDFKIYLKNSPSFSTIDLERELNNQK